MTRSFHISNTEKVLIKFSIGGLDIQVSGELNFPPFRKDITFHQYLTNTTFFILCSNRNPKISNRNTARVYRCKKYLA
jgi:hypothetical protein